VDSAQNAVMAMEKLMDAIHANQPIDTIFIDMEMPQIDGKTLARQLIDDPNIKNIKLIHMAYTGKRLDKNSLDTIGFHAQIAKPVYRGHVLDCLKDLHGIVDKKETVETRIGIETPESALGVVARELKVLLAEDNMMNQKVACNMLKKIGHVVTIANNGKEAVDLYKKGGFDIILMDGQMPVMDGLEATRTIRKIETKSNAHIPIIALTANAMKGDRERFLESGMDDFITKPIKRKALEDAILNSSKSLPAQEPVIVETREPDIIKEDIIDLDELIQTMNGDKNLVKECFDDYFQNHGPMLNDIRRAIDQSHEAKVKESLLTFRDSVKHLSCKMIMDAAFSLDRAFSAKKETLVEKEFIRLYESCEKLKNFIVTYSVKHLFMKFLLVDDEFSSRKKAAKTLTKYGECDVAINGLEALNAFVRAQNENDAYNLIFLDIDMPNFDGNQVLLKIRQWEASKNISKDHKVKVVMLSTEELDEKGKNQLNTGDETYIVKPITRAKLANAFKQVHYI